ncbi:hypothetical protein QE152_g38728 [Popillia japonica]|uniref:Tc1-like transposase DDE domain-containing protein n=1 Tax=Popillia japonica TaxID=7064 RepID=A0AAW1HW45_POPJA
MSDQPGPSRNLPSPPKRRQRLGHLSHDEKRTIVNVYKTLTLQTPRKGTTAVVINICGTLRNVISLNNDVHNTIFVSQNIGPFSNTKEILGDNTDESQLPESPPKHFIEGSGNEDNEFKETFKINILQNIIIKNNGNGSHYQADEVDTNNLQHEEESEVPPYLREESSDTTELEQEQEEKSVEIRETRGKKRKRNAGNWKKNIRKQRKAAGEEYLSATNKLFGKNEMKAPCRDECKKQCKQNISVESRALIHSQFWNGSIELDQKRQFISSCIEELPVERVRARTGSRAGKRVTSLKVRQIYPALQPITFVQDNSAVDAAKVVRDWFDGHDEIEVIPWPAKSPDLIPTEKLWSDMSNMWDQRDVSVPRRPISSQPRSYGRI